MPQTESKCRSLASDVEDQCNHQEESDAIYDETTTEVQVVRGQNGQAVEIKNSSSIRNVDNESGLKADVVDGNKETQAFETYLGADSSIQPPDLQRHDNIRDNIRPGAFSVSASRLVQSLNEDESFEDNTSLNSCANISGNDPYFFAVDAVLVDNTHDNIPPNERNNSDLIIVKANLVSDDDHINDANKKLISTVTSRNFIIIYAVILLASVLITFWVTQSWTEHEDDETQKIANNPK